MKKKIFDIVKWIIIVAFCLYLLETTKNIYTYLRFIKPRPEHIYKHIEGKGGHLTGIWEGRFNVTAGSNWLDYSIREFYFFNDSTGLYIEKTFRYPLRSEVHSWAACLPHKNKPCVIITNFIRVNRDDSNYFEFLPLRFITDPEKCDSISEDNRKFQLDYYRWYSKYLIKNDSLYVENYGTVNKRKDIPADWLVNDHARYPFYVYLNPFYVRKMWYYM